MDNRLVEKERVYQDDEIDLFEILKILIKEKNIIISTFLIISLVSLGVGIYEKGAKKEVKTIVSLNLNEGKFFNGEKFNKRDLLPITIINKVYTKENIKEKNSLTLDEFKNKFKIEGIVPKNILENKEQLSKYIPTNYNIGLRVGSVKESKNILEKYYRYLNENYMDLYASKYEFKKLNIDTLLDKSYDYQDNIDLLKKENLFLEKNLESKLKGKISSDSTRVEYKKLDIALQNLEDININGLENYLEVSGIVKNIDKFNREYTNKQEKLKQNIEIEKELSLNYKKVLEKYSDKEKNIEIPKGTNIKIDNKEKDNYYSELVNNYLESQNRIEKIKTQLLVLQNKNENLQKMTEVQKTYVEKELLLMYKEYNSIVNKINFLDSQETLVENNQMIKLIVPVEVVSYSKWKLIVIIGSVVGLFMGVLLAFVKNFMGSFKKSLHVLSIFLIVTSLSYSAQENSVKIQFIGNRFSKGLNLDKTQFIKDKVILDEFILKRYKLNKSEIENIEIYPISSQNAYEMVKESIVNGNKMEYFPSEYTVKLNLKNKELENKIYADLKNNFSKDYIKKYTDNSMKIEKIEYVKKYENYRDSIIAFNNIIIGLENEIEDYQLKERNLENKLEYNNILLELKNLKGTKLIGVENYINSNRLSLDIPMEKLLLKGEEISINREIGFLNEKEKVYKELLNNLKGNKRELILQNNGNIILGGSGDINNKNYISLTKKYLKSLNSKKKLQIKLDEINKKYKLMKNPDDLEKKKIFEKFNSLEKSLNKIIVQIENLQLKKTNREKNIIKVI